MKLLLALALALALAPVASAHVDSYTQFRSFDVGPYKFAFEPRPAIPFADNPMSIVANFADNNTGALLRSVNASVLVAGPEEFVHRGPMNPDGTGYHVASMTLPAAGMYSVRVIVRDDSGNYSATSEFEAFPDIPYRIRPVDASADATVGVITRLAFEIVDADTLARKDPGDLAVRVEHWTEDHTQMLGYEDATPERVSAGVWRIEHVFKETGMHHIRFASAAGGFNYADVPLLHVYATAAPAVVEKDTPFPTLGGVALVVLLGLGLSLVLRERR